MPASDRLVLRDLPDGTYIELVASLCGTRVPAVIMTVLFLLVGGLSVHASRDMPLAALVAVGAAANVARLAVLLRGRKLCDTTDVSAAAARRFERRFALSYWAFAALLGGFAARACMLPPGEWQMPIGILVVGYAAGAASTVAMRPAIVVGSLCLAVIPPACVLLLCENPDALLSSLCLLALLAGGLRSTHQRYRSQSAKAATRYAFARQAQTDHLTGLGNRLALAAAFAANSGEARPGRIALHYVDLDDFKPVNDTFGHHAGDALLCLVAERLRACRDPGDVVVRLGGDEFVLVQGDTASDLDVERHKTRIERSLNAPYSVGGRVLAVGASVGSSRHTGPAQTLAALLIAADAALRQKKDRRRTAGPPAAGPHAIGAPPPDSLDDAAARERAARARLVAGGHAVASWESAPDGLIETDSPSWRAYTGQSYDDWKGYGWLTAIHPDDRVATVRKWRDTVHDRQSVEAEYRLRRHDGVYRWMQVQAVPLRDRDGTIVRWLGVNIDIDDRKQAPPSPTPTPSPSPSHAALPARQRTASGVAR